MIALVIFLAGSILCSLAWNAASLIAFRAFQGLGGGLLMPLMMTIVMQAARGQNLGKMATAIGLPIALGPILGPVIGGLILTHLHWSWMFWVNVPFCVAGLILAWLFLPHDAAVHWVRLDVVGLVLLAPGLAAMLYGLTGAAQGGAFTRFQAWGPIMAGVVLVGAFCLWALARREHALVNVRLLSHRPLATASVLMFLSGFGLFGAMFLLPLYFQTVRGATVLSAGVILIPQGVGTLLSRVAIGRFIDKVGPRWITLPAFLITALATIPFAFASTTTSQWWLMAALLFRGLGLGAALIPLMAHGFLGLAHDEVPDAAIVSRIIQQLGGSFGTAILATVLTSASVGAASLSDAAHAFDRAFWWAVAFSGLAVLISLILPGDEPAPTVAPQ
jgi:EmrB/QacA subfamily drug resistance transporter